MGILSLAVICDLREENWPSMDLVGEMLLKHLQLDHAVTLQATRVCPQMHHRLTRQRSEVRGQKSEIRAKLFNADRLLNRFWDYPRVARWIRNDFDLFH